MKIIHIITRLIVGGAQENTLFTCRGLAEKGHAVTLIAGPQTGPEGSLWDRATAGGVEAVVMPELLREVSPWSDLSCLMKLTALFKETSCDVVHTHSSKAGILGRLAARRADVPLVVHTIHGMSFNRTQSALTRAVYRMFEQRAGACTDAFISVADAMTREAVVGGLGVADRFSTIYSGMEVARFSPDAETRGRVRQAWGVKDDAVVVGTIARLFRNKGYESIINTMSAVANACPGVHWVWVGDGPDRRRYEQAVRDLGLTDRLHLTGLVPPERIPELLCGFDLLVHASEWEGLPRALPQALLCEVPVVSFDNDGAPEVIDPGVTGELVRLGDTDGLAEAVIKLVNDAPLRQRMGQAGRAVCLTRFDWRTMVDQIERLYQKNHPGS